MPVVGGIDIHRAQLTFDYVDLDSGEVVRGRIVPADRERLRRWLQRFADRDQVAFALEGCMLSDIPHAVVPSLPMNTNCG